jgi:hypothetical protein
VSETERLRELLRVEFLRHSPVNSPWLCVEADCPYFGKPANSCLCVKGREREHVAAVKKEIGL